MKYELSNNERKYLGLEPIQEGWEYETLKGDKYRPESTLVFDGDVIKRHIVSTYNSYIEKQYDDKTKERKILLPKTNRGKEKKLTSSTFEKLTPKGVYFNYSLNDIQIASYSTQTTFYSTRMEEVKIENISEFQNWLKDYINQTTESNQLELEEFINSKRKNIRAKTGDIFAFKVDRNNYGFGQVIENIAKIRKELPKHHGLNNLMGQPLLIKLFHYIVDTKDININLLHDKKSTPSQYIFDNNIYYGEYPIIGNIPIDSNDLDFPISFGRVIYASPEVFFQWGLIHKQKPLSKFNKYLTAINTFVPEDSPSRITNNAYAKNGIGFQLDINKKTLENCILQSSNTPYWNQTIFEMKNDLRNPMNEQIKREIFYEFGIDESVNYKTNLEKMK